MGKDEKVPGMHGWQELERWDEATSVVGELVVVVLEAVEENKEEVRKDIVEAVLVVEARLWGADVVATVDDEGEDDGPEGYSLVYAP